MVIGCDLNSRKIALVKLRQGHMSTKVFASKAKDRQLIVGELYAFTRRWIMPGDIVHIEAPVLAGARNIQSTIKCAAAYGAVLAAVNEARATAIEVPVSSWKVAIVGKGNASKLDVSQWLHSQHPDHHRECGSDQDLIDATCIALYAQQAERSTAASGGGSLLHQAADQEHPGHRHHGD